MAQAELKQGLATTITVADYLKQQHIIPRSPIVAAKVNNLLKPLTAEIDPEQDKIEFVDLTSDEGLRIYRRSLYFLLTIAAKQLFPECQISIEHSLGAGVYCEFRPACPLDLEDAALALEKRMRELVAADLPFTTWKGSKKDAYQILLQQGHTDKARILRNRVRGEVELARFGEIYDYFTGFLVPSTGYLTVFGLRPYLEGFVLQLPDKQNPFQVVPFYEQKKLALVYDESKDWIRNLDLHNVEDINKIIGSGQFADLVLVAEARHEKKISEIAEAISACCEQAQLVLVAGPSSSGKTTFTQRLRIQLLASGIKPLAISLDDYFVNREDTPKDENGNYDFESIDALDLPLFNQHLVQLLAGEEVEIPRFNFVTGRREWTGNKLQLKPRQVLIIEGIHGLNERLTAQVPSSQKIKIYVSALTHVNIDKTNQIHSSDIRLLRRICRDAQFRGSPAARTIAMWPAVRRGEERNIFPFQEEADFVFNSGLVYELAVLKNLAEPLLKQITPDQAEYSEAVRLLEFLRYFLAAPADVVPNNSVLREFIGGCCFYH
ncbi:uridine kinase [Carboxydocella sporoproducens DSM 16521]|uniref:Uridine kinase n=2 Tax=Carboxydocella TaxID=178898 RepID=A0A1T4NV10_9FIRM|nr:MULTISPECIES: nucleoside kinase [Carboxydocella]AVX20172.1 uridine kinase [Carboxydocella thermautotrophica]SJZ83043.1 uridine kinase [Carboxydocella sporoproducens DSM 16521]